MKTLPRTLIGVILWLVASIGHTVYAEDTADTVVLPVEDLKVFAEIFGKNNLSEVIAVDSCNVGLCLWQSFGLEIFPSSSILIKTRNKEPSYMRSPGFI